MAVIDTPAIICALRPHGEHGVIVRVMTPDHGLIAGYVRGGRSRKLRPILIPGNAVVVTLTARAPDQLGSLTAELTHSRAPLMSEPLAAAALDWVTSLTAKALPEGQPYPEVYDALSAVLEAIAMAPAARGWAQALVRYELIVLQSLGFGLALDRCVVTGVSDDLAYVSPKSAAAVSRDAAVGYERQLLPLPSFLTQPGAQPGIDDVMAGLRLSGFFLERRLFDDHRDTTLSVRQRMLDRLQRAIA